jgi:hypothetical protein
VLNTVVSAAVDAYLTAQQRGEVSTLPATTPVKHVENGADVSLERGILATPLAIDFHRSLLDVAACCGFPVGGQPPAR